MGQDRRSSSPGQQSTHIIGLSFVYPSRLIVAAYLEAIRSKVIGQELLQSLAFLEKKQKDQTMEVPVN